MSWIGPYIVPLLIAAFVVRRMIKNQKAKRVRFWRLFLLPGIVVFVALATLFTSSFPGILALLFIILAGVLGGAIGWYRVHTLQFTTDPETGAVHTKGTPLSAILFVGLFAARYVLKDIVHTSAIAPVASLVHGADAGLIFSASLLAAQSAHTWVKARALLARPMSTMVFPPPRRE